VCGAVPTASRCEGHTAGEKDAASRSTAATRAAFSAESVRGRRQLSASLLACAGDCPQHSCATAPGLQHAMSSCTGQSCRSAAGEGTAPLVAPICRLAGGGVSRAPATPRGSDLEHTCQRCVARRSLGRLAAGAGQRWNQQKGERHYDQASSTAQQPDGCRAPISPPHHCSRLRSSPGCSRLDTRRPCPPHQRRYTAPCPNRHAR
jgi:hypothetical protein